MVAYIIAQSAARTGDDALAAPRRRLAGRREQLTAARHLTLAAKRGVDVLVSTVGMVALAPVGLCAALAVLLEDGPPVLHAARRTGRYGHAFTMYKLRTMRRDAASLGPAITAAGDVRITRIGRVLRATKLDELPQLWNVARGEMSMVGPRPEAPAYVALYTPAQRRVLNVRPGITGPAQLRFRDEARLLRTDHAHEDYVERVLPAKLAIDLDYVATLSLWRDISIIARTAAVLLSRSPYSLKNSSIDAGSVDVNRRGLASTSEGVRAHGVATH